MATFMARKITEAGWWHTAATFIQVEMLTKMHAQENWNDIALMRELENILARVVGGIAQGLCRLGPHFKSQLELSAEGVQ